jgi:hypothetical protein
MIAENRRLNETRTHAAPWGKWGLGKEAVVTEAASARRE